MRPYIRRWLLLLAAGLALAWGMNRLILEIVGESSPYRAEHGMAGMIFLVGYVWLYRREKGAVPFFLLAALPTYGGTALPDLDISWFGIGAHRNPIFHSAIAYLLPIAFIRRPHPAVATALIGFGLGLGSHLLWDIIDYGDVRWMPGGLVDRLWLLANGLLCFLPPRGTGNSGDE